VDRRRMHAAEGLGAHPGPSGRAWRRILLGALAFPGVALAQLDFPPLYPAQTHLTPYADGAYEHNSNLFALSNSGPEPAGRNGPTLADTILRVRAGIDSAYDWGLQEFYFNGEGRRFTYDQFTQLDHNEYLLRGGLKWKIASLLDGVLDYQRERSMVSFLQFNAAQFASEQLYLQVQSVGTASINLQITPEWRLQNQGTIRDVNTALPGFPHLRLREDGIHEGIRYVGFANLSAGLDGEYLSGNFTGGDFLITPGYHQSTGELAADYVLSGLTTFHGAVGYTTRKEDQRGSTSGVTGLLSYQRNLTGKTSINLKVSRAINTYITAATPEIDTGAELDVAWNATEKIKVEAGYQWLHSSFAPTDIAGVVTATRVDRLQTSSLSVKYQPLKWLLVRPYAAYQTRSSTINIFTFNGTLYGIELEGRLPLR
jgi:hypothetical protein